MTKKKPAKAELTPVPWPDIEPHWKAGIRTLTELHREFGVSRAGIIKHARLHGWGERDLRHAIQAKADLLLSRRVVTSDGRPVVTPEVTNPPKYTDEQITEAGAQQLVLVRIEHREDIKALRGIIKGLMSELALTMDAPERLWVSFDALTDPDTRRGEATLRDIAELVSSLPARTSVAKALAEALHKCIGMEREAHGLGTAGGTDGERYTVLIKDYTGRGDPDSPRAREKTSAQPEEETLP